MKWVAYACMRKKSCWVVIFGSYLCPCIRCSVGCFAVIVSLEAHLAAVSGSVYDYVSVRPVTHRFVFCVFINACTLVRYVFR